MRYSPLVERYLITHNYETINNVRKWKMLLTQRNEIQDNVDRKFKKYRQIADASLKLRNNLNAEFEATCKKLNDEHAANKEAAKNRMDANKKEYQEKANNGTFPEYSNMVASINQSKHNGIND